MSDPRISERLRRAADPLPVDVEGRLEGARRRAKRRQTGRRVGAGVVAAAIGAGALAAIWSLRLGDDTRPAVPVPAGTILHVVIGEEWLDSELYALAVGDDPPGTAVPWPGGTTPLAAPSYTPDGSQVTFLIDTGERNEAGMAPLFDIAVQRGSDPVEVLVEDVDIVAEPEMGPLGQVAFVRSGGRRDDELVIVAPDGTVGEPVATGLAMTALAWSPDGSTIAVHGLVNLPDGRGAGSPIALLSPDGTVLQDVRLELDRYPSRGVTTLDWSPDGSTLAWTTYAEDGTSDIYLMDADGSYVRMVTPEGSPDDASVRYPIWAPEGDWLAFASDRDAAPAVRAANAERDVQRGFGLYAMRSDGTEVQTLIPPAEDAGPLMIDWLPSESPASEPTPTSTTPDPIGVLLWGNKGTAGPKGTGLPHVYVQRADGSDEPVEVEDAPMFVAPDGSKIMWEAFMGDQVSNLLVGNPDRSSARVVAILDVMNLSWLDWSRDGSRIAYTYATDGGMELWVTDVTTGEASVISTMPGMFGVSWAPDGSRVAVAVGSAETGVPGVYTMAPDGSDVQQVSALDSIELAWSPDGDDIAVTGERLGDDDTRGLWLVDVAGSDRGGEDLIEPGASYPMWSPDGDWLLYSAVDPGSDDDQPVALYLMRPDGSDDRMLVPDPGEGWPIPWVWLARWPL